MSRHANNAINIIRRSKNYLDNEMKNQNSGYQVKLPNIGGYKNNEYYMQQMRRNQGSNLPPISNSGGSLNYVGPGQY
jgi:hypothetical protein